MEQSIPKSVARMLLIAFTVGFIGAEAIFFYRTVFFKNEDPITASIFILILLSPLVIMIGFKRMYWLKWCIGPVLILKGLVFIIDAMENGTNILYYTGFYGVFFGAHVMRTKALQYKTIAVNLKPYIHRAIQNQ